MKKEAPIYILRTREERKNRRPVGLMQSHIVSA